MSGPFTPKQALAAANAGTIPEQVFDAFNAFLSDRAGDAPSGIMVKQDEVLALLAKAWPQTKRHVYFEKGWLDVEAAYRKAGWRVTFDKPGYNESGGAFWVFRSRP